MSASPNPSETAAADDLTSGVPHEIVRHNKVVTVWNRFRDQLGDDQEDAGGRLGQDAVSAMRRRVNDRDLHPAAEVDKRAGALVDLDARNEPGRFEDDNTAVNQDAYVVGREVSD